MKVSVVLTTARYGGWDVLADCMAAQTMDKADFEVIVVDVLHHLRPAFSAGLSFFGFHFVHVPSEEAGGLYDNGRCFNQGLRLAQGELACFLIDYMWVSPDYLERHWDFYRDNPGWTFSGYVDRYDFPALREDEKGGLWSMFAEPFTPTYFWNHAPVYRERKGNAGKVHAEGRIEMPGEKIYLIPDSIPMAVLRQLNGLDEIYDGGYGVNDIDLGERANMLGHRFALDPTLLARKLGTPELSARIPGARKPYRRNLSDRESWAENYAVYEARMRAIREGHELVAVPPGRGAWR